MQAAERIGRRIKLRDLNALLVVIEQGSMSKAADVLAVSRPVVSKTISELEQSLGVRLLDRGPGRIEPTPFGKALVKRAAVVFDELRQGVGELEFLADPSAGELRIGCSEYMAAGLIPAAIERLSRRYPQLLFRLELGDIHALQNRELRERKLDLVVGRLLSPAVAADMTAESLFYERVFIAAGSDSKWAGRRKVTLSDLVDEQWMLAPLEMAEGSPVVEAFRAAGLAVPQARVLGYSLPLRNALLASGRYLTVLPGSVLRFGAERRILKALPVVLPKWPLPVALVTLKNRTLGPAAQLFIDTIRDIAKPLAAD